MKREYGFAVSHVRDALLRRIAVLRIYIRPILTDRVAWSVSLSVGLTVSHTSGPCKNGWNDRLAVWLRTPMCPRNHVLHGVQIPLWKGQFWRRNGQTIVKYNLQSTVQKAESIDVPFGFWARVGPRNHVLDGVQIPHGKGEFLYRGAHCKV